MFSDSPSAVTTCTTYVYSCHHLLSPRANFADLNPVAVLRAVCCRPLQNIPMSTFLNRSRSHPSVVTLQGATAAVICVLKCIICMHSVARRA